MYKYRIKPENVEAMKFDGRNWGQIVLWLGPHLTNTEDDLYDHSEEAESKFVFDIEHKRWLPLYAGHYIVKDSNGALRVLSAEEFERKWEREPNLFPNPILPGVLPYPTTQPIVTYGGSTA